MKDTINSLPQDLSLEMSRSNNKSDSNFHSKKSRISNISYDADYEKSHFTESTFPQVLAKETFSSSTAQSTVATYEQARSGPFHEAVLSTEFTHINSIHLAQKNVVSENFESNQAVIEKMQTEHTASPTYHSSHTQSFHAQIPAQQKKGLYFRKSMAKFGHVMVGSMVRSKIELCNPTNQEVRLDHSPLALLLLLMTTVIYFYLVGCVSWRPISPICCASQ